MRSNTFVQKGFTLIEVMIVVAIVGILAAVAYPAYTSQIAKGRRAECRSGLLQSMQQQERYFSQYNSYAAFAENDAAAKTKGFSGDSAPQSACLITAALCTAPGLATAAGCIELQARLVRPESNITVIYLDSDGRKGCVVSAARNANDKTCWP